MYISQNMLLSYHVPCKSQGVLKKFFKLDEFGSRKVKEHICKNG